MIFDKLLALALVCPLSFAAKAQAADLQSTQGLLGLPERPANALGGSSFIRSIRNLPTAQREHKIVEEVLRGNIPEFQRRLVPIDRKVLSGPYRGKVMRYWVLPDYLAIGSDRDFVRVPLNMYSITTLAQKLNLSLPTTPMVDDIYAQAQVKLKPTTLPSGRAMTSVQYFYQHNSLVQEQLVHSTWKPGMLVAGHKKDVVQSQRLTAKPKAVAIYGWHKQIDKPIQPLSTVHGAEYADYSHGVRFVSNIVEVNHQMLDLRTVLNRQLSSSLANR